MDTGKQMKKETISMANCIELDKEKVKEAIESSGYYEEEGVKIKRWEGDKESDYFLGSLKKGRNSYVGVMNTVLRRDNYGVNFYDNGDIYFGVFDSDVKNKHGVYFFAPTIQNGYANSEAYFGFWKANQKETRGIYMWLKEKHGDEVFETTDFDAYVGEVENDNYKRGCYLTKIGESFYVYYGSFDSDGRKNDENAFFYDNVRDRVFKGKIVKDKFVNGYLIGYDEENNVKNLIYIEFDNNDTPTKFLKTEEIEEDAKTTLLHKVNIFRNFLLGEDHFTTVYTKVKSARKFIDNNLADFHIIDSEDEYPKIMTMASSYNDVKLYSALEKLMKD